MINAIIVDDEAKAIKILRWEIEKFCSGVTVVDTFTNATEAIYGINYLKPDCVFLDIEMPEMDGFQLLNELKFRNFQLIISTAYNNYAIKAFKENAIDYLLKPIDSDDLKRAVQKVIQLKEGNTLEFQLDRILKTMAPPQSKKVQIPLVGRTVYIDQNDLLYCKSDGNYTEFHLNNGDCEVVTKNLKEVVSEFLTPDFFRVHNSYSININHIKEYIKSDGHYLIMSNKANIPISRSKKDALLQRIGV